MNKQTLGAGVLLCACWLPSVSHAELNDRTKKLLQTESVNRSQEGTVSKQKDPSSRDNASDPNRSNSQPMNPGNDKTTGQPPRQ